MKLITRGVALLAILLSSSAIAQTAGPVTVVAHIDFIPTNLAQGLPTLQQFAQQSKGDPGVRSFTLITWAPTTNHFQLIEVFDSLKDYNNHVQSPHTVAFRTALQPLIGSPYDERLYQPLEQDGGR